MAKKNPFDEFMPKGNPMGEGEEELLAKKGKKGGFMKAFKNAKRKSKKKGKK